MNDEIIKTELSAITEDLHYSLEQLSAFSEDMTTFLSRTREVLYGIAKEEVDQFNRFNLVFNEFYVKFNAVDSELEQFKVELDELSNKIHSGE